MADKTGAARLRQAIKNQRDLGNGDFRLTYHDAEEIADEIDAELLGICSSAEREIGRYAWAHGVPAPVDADGEVVPLTMRVMYDDDGGEMTIKSFTFYVDGGFWRTDPECPSVYAIDRVDLLHLHRPDSWERLEEDVRNAENGGAPAATTALGPSPATKAARATKTWKLPARQSR